MDLIGMRIRVDQLVQQYGALKANCDHEAATMAKAEDNVAAATLARDTAQAVGQAVQESAHAQISAVVSRCLAAVFDDPYEFQVRFEQKRGRTEAQLLFLRNGEALDPLSAAGGGAVDVAAFALRVAAISLTQPKCRRVLIMDEPFRFLSKAYQTKVQGMLKALARDMDFQFIYVTHEPNLTTRNVVFVE